MDNEHKGKRYGNHDNANYKNGTRSKIMGLLLYVGVLPAKSLGLIDLYERTVRRKAYFMTNEGILKKERLKAGEWVYRIARMPKDEREVRDLQEAFPELYDQYIENRAMMMHRVKGSTWCGDSQRMVRNAETVMFMDALPVTYMPGEKGSINDAFTGNTFYTSAEVREYQNPDNPVKTGYTRANGVMFTQGGTYVVYDYSENLMEFKKGQETMVQYLALQASVLNGLETSVSAIALYRTDDLLQSIVEEKKYYASTQEVLEGLYQGVYALPLSREGQELAAYMCKPGWEKMIKKAFKVEKKWENSNTIETDDQYYSDGEAVVNKNGKETRIYVFVYGIPDIKRFRRFIDYVSACGYPDRFEIRCFDFQCEAVTRIVGGKLSVRVYPFDGFKEYAKYYESIYESIHSKI